MIWGLIHSLSVIYATCGRQHTHTASPVLRDRVARDD